ncbi:MAG: trypsin-like peptidase domain-containing protein [Dehalococcoidia bacterium]
MTGRPWIVSGALALVVVVSMTLGALIARQTGGAGRTPVAVQRETATKPVAAPAIALASGGIADVVDRAVKSTVVIEGGTAAGSGVVIDRDGHVVTNYHVVEGQKTLKVVLQDGSASRATVLGSDPSTDLAVLQTEFARDQLTPATIGDSSVVRTGDAVFAIGAPFNQPFTVTSGIISATQRSTQSSFTGRSIRDVLQTDAAVNPGNSGGPLFNINGEMIGINTSIENPNGRFFVGLGFAIPSNTVLKLVPDLIAGKTVSHAQLGVSVLALDEVVASDLGLGVTRGLYVTSVQPSSAASRAGIVAAEAPQARTGQQALPGKGGDVIVSIGGRDAKTFTDLARAIDGADVGTAVNLTVLRNGQRVNLSATLQAWDLRAN